MPPHIREVRIWNYKSIAQVAATLEPFTALVGQNGAGKSNFMDALAFVQESLSGSVELAFKTRGGIGAVRRKSGGHPTNISIRLVLDLEQGCAADYSFEIAAKPGERFRIAKERCVVRRLMQPDVVLEIQNGKFTRESAGIRASLPPDRLALFVVSATPEFKPVYDFLVTMRSYSVLPLRLRELQDADPGEGEFLARDGSNAAAVLKRIQAHDDRDRYERLCRILGKAVRGIKSVEYRPVGQNETLCFKQDVGQKHPWRFDALNMSDGTLRLLGLLLAVYQPGKPSVIALEEPEATVHPAITELIVQVLMEASHERQILVTTHSPDILDYRDLTDSQIRVVTVQDNKTIIAPISQGGRDAIREHLYTAGELLRLNELNPDLKAAEAAGKKQVQLDLGC